MKTLKIYKRTILERSHKGGYFKEINQIIVIYNNKEYKNDHFEKLDNPRLKVKFVKRLETRKKKVVENVLKTLGRTKDERWLKETLTNILEEDR